MIPKKIHYIWFGSQALPESAKRCIESWQKFCPDYEIVFWNQSNYDIESSPFVKEAFEAKKYAFASDYARLDIVNKFGGFYLDTDVELVDSLDSLRSYEAVMGTELPGRVATGLGFGAVAHSKIVELNLAQYQGLHFKLNSKYNLKTCVEYTTNLLIDYGLQPIAEIQHLDGVTILPPEYLCPIDIGTSKLHMTANTLSIHHYAATWYSANPLIRKLNQHLLPYKVKLREFIDAKYGTGSYDKVKKILKL